jgi:hypothetical protein
VEAYGCFWNFEFLSLIKLVTRFLSFNSFLFFENTEFLVNFL